MSLKFLLDFSLIKKTIWNSVYSVYSGAKLNYWNFFVCLLLCVCVLLSNSMVSGSEEAASWFD